MYYTIQGVQIKNNPLEKNSVFQQRWHGFEPNSRTLYENIQTTHPANFIETTDMVQQIQQFSFKVHFFRVKVQSRIKESQIAGQTLHCSFSSTVHMTLVMERR